MSAIDRANYVHVSDFCFVCRVSAGSSPPPETWTNWVGSPRTYFLHSCPDCSEKLMSREGLPSIGDEPAREEMTLEWRTDKMYWNGNEAEYAWVHGSRDYHWQADGPMLGIYQNEYDRQTRLDYKEGRTQERTKQLAQRIQNVLDGAPVGQVLTRAQTDELANLVMGQIATLNSAIQLGESQTGDPDFWTPRITALREKVARYSSIADALLAKATPEGGTE